MIESVQRKVRDASYGPEDILALFNRGINEIAGWKNTRPEFGLHGEILLPNLETVAPLDTAADLANIDLPDTYMKNLYMVSQPSKVPILIWSSMQELLRQWEGTLVNSGPNVEDVTIMGGQLYYQPIPTEVLELYLYFYRKPDVLTLEAGSGLVPTDIPACLPEDLQEDLLVNYAAMEIYDEIEDGLDGQKMQTQSYAGKYQAALNKLYKAITHKSPQRLARPRAVGFF